MDSFFWFDTTNFESPLYISRGVRLKIKKSDCIFCLKIFCYLTNSVDPDEMQQYAAFHLGLHCLQMYSYRVFPNTKVNT